MCDDVVLLTLQYSTQWDSLAHVGQQFDVDGDGIPEMVFYNGFRAGEHVVGPVDYRDGKETQLGSHVGAKMLGIENMARTCVQGRAVMVDLHAHLRPRTQDGRLRRPHERPGEGQGRRWSRGTSSACARDSTAYCWSSTSSPTSRCTTSARYSTGAMRGCSSGSRTPDCVALIADNYAVEAHPAVPCPPDHDHCASLPLHAHCLFRLGVYLGEIWYLSELADWLRANNRNRFLLTAPPLRLPGAVGSPATPVGTV